MLSFCEKCKGAISVFLTLILLPTFVFGGVIVDGSRVLGAKNLISGAGDLAMNAALSNYYEELNTTYGLLAMAETPEEVEDVLKDFFETTLNTAGISEENFSKALIYLEMTEDFSAVAVDDTQIYETEVLKQEILEYMKYRAPVTLANRGLIEKAEEFKDIDKVKKASDAELKFESELNDAQDLFDEIKELSDELQDEIYPSIKTESGLNVMLNIAETDYDRVTMLSVAHRRLVNCGDSEDGDPESMMKRMWDIAPALGTITSTKASYLIEMEMIENGMEGIDPEIILESVTPDTPEYYEKQSIISNYNQACSILAEGKELTYEQAEDLVDINYTVINGQYNLGTRGKEICDEIIDKSDKLLEKMKSMRGKFNNWKGAVNDLSESETKTAFNENIKEVEGLFVEDGYVNTFKEKIINNKTFYTEVVEQLEQVTFSGQTLCSEIDSYEDVYSQAPIKNIILEDEIESAGAEFDLNYNDADMVLSVINESIEDDEFVKLLDEKFCNIEESNKEKAKEETKKWGDELKSYTEKLKTLLLTDDIDKLNIDELGNNDLPSDWLNSPSGNVSGDTDIPMSGGLDKSSTRKIASNTGSDILNSNNEAVNGMSKLATELSKGGEYIVEPLYLTEYILGMFSHYKCDLGENGKKIEPLSINDSKLSNNEAYKAEIEYILWGDPDTRDNVAITKAIIFAANFVFNMTFAFTNATIRTDALKIAAFFPVGALAKTAIKCALQAMVAMIETVKNMVDIMNGESIPLVKSTTWETPIITDVWPDHDGKNGFSYEDYLWIMICVKMFIPSTQTSMLARTADCIELNLTDAKEKEDNTLKDKYTMVQIDTSVSIETFFLNKLSGAGYDVEEVNDETFKIEYTGVQAY